jgi:hypothetical protein
MHDDDDRRYGKWTNAAILGADYCVSTYSISLIIIITIICLLRTKEVD